MSINTDIIDRLLYEDEGTTLDFKSDQYPFEHALNDEKSELLKDILAFTNAWRRTDAYILIGVEDVKGGKSIVIGVSKHLDDANLQQFVNSKTQQPIHFSYHSLRFEEEEIGIIHIPLQERPRYLKKKFGKLEKEKIYIRRGSATVIAAPDEIAKMGAAGNFTSEAIPLLDVEFYNSDSHEPLGKSVKIETINLIIPSSLPDYKPDYQYGGYLSDLGVNRDYYREYAKFIQKRSRLKELNFCVSNSGSVVANDVRLMAEIKDEQKNFFLMNKSDMPKEPSRNPSLLDYTIMSPGFTPSSEIEVQEISVGWRIEGHIIKVQPRAKSITEGGFFIGASESTELPLQITVYADNLPTPKTVELSIQINTEEKEFDLNRLWKFMRQ